jgi:hypothetical protein
MDTEGNVKARVAPKLKGGLDAAPKSGESAPELADAPAVTTSASTTN